MRGLFINSLKLVRFILRRERINSVIWIAALVFISAAIPPVLNEQFGRPEDSAALLMTMENPAMIAMMGPIFEGEYTIGAMYANMMLLLTMIAVCIMNIFLVVRHTRGDEEKWRMEVIRSLPVGRLANLNAVMITAVIVNAVLAVLTGLGMAALGIESISFGGSMLFGAALGTGGLFAAVVAALFSQLSSTSRGAVGYSTIVLGLLYLLRGIGDVSSEVLAMASPLGMILRVQVYVNNYWWPVFAVLLISAVIALAAYYLDSTRDMDQGFIPVKPGKVHARKYMRSSFGFAWRLMRGTLIAWVLGMFVLSASYGAVMGDVETFIGDNEFFQQIIPQSPDFEQAELFMTMINAMMAIVCAVPIIVLVFKLRNEERELRAEHIISRSVSRYRYIAGFALMAFAVSIIAPFMSAAGLYSAAASVMETPIAFGSILKAIMVYVPAIWVMIGVSVLIVGVLPKAAAFCWAYFAFAFFSAYLGAALGMPEWMVKSTPFGWIPQLPLDEVHALTLILLSFIALVLTCIGFAFYRKRDMLT
ncbi:MAG: ABC transporter permease [Defluviitaleaceae bacterium]|nr:ABC transporter permease [Defluviitaleaceae bacterium]